MSMTNNQSGNSSISGYVQMLLLILPIYAMILTKTSKRLSSHCHGRTGRGGGGREGWQPPQFVGQTTPVGQYSLHSRAILAYYKNKWDKFCGKYAI